jgi:hypothetical protein
MLVEATPGAVAFVREHGGQLFVWPTAHRSFRLTLTLLDASTEPPDRVLEYRRIDTGDFLLFLHPAIRRLPGLLQIELRGHRHDRVEAYWEGLAYVM